ncbi:MAG: hypothetical protein JW818_18065 [Pirellulales bacterium]|nr:hypothetical protein [Pirellulales bacterium]
MSLPADVLSLPNAHVRCPLCEAEFALNQVDTLVAPEVIPLVGEADATAVSVPTDLPTTLPDIQAAAEAAVETGEAEKQSDDTSDDNTSTEASFDFVPDANDDSDDSAAAVAARLRKGGKRGSVLREIVKIVLGGVAGLAIGYYGLNYYQGAQCDWLGIYLPGCPHTYHHWPGPNSADPDSTDQDSPFWSE